LGNGVCESDVQKQIITSKNRCEYNGADNEVRLRETREENRIPWENHLKVFNDLSFILNTLKLYSVFYFIIYTL